MDAPDKQTSLYPVRLTLQASVSGAHVAGLPRRFAAGFCALIHTGADGFDYRIKVRLWGSTTWQEVSCRPVVLLIRVWSSQYSVLN